MCGAVFFFNAILPAIRCVFGTDANDGDAEGFLRIYYFDGDPALNVIFHGRCRSPLQQKKAEVTAVRWIHVNTLAYIFSWKN